MRMLVLFLHSRCISLAQLELDCRLQDKLRRRPLFLIAHLPLRSLPSTFDRSASFVVVPSEVIPATAPQPLLHRGGSLGRVSSSLGGPGSGWAWMRPGHGPGRSFPHPAIAPLRLRQFPLTCRHSRSPVRSSLHAISDCPGRDCGPCKRRKLAAAGESRDQLRPGPLRGTPKPGYGAVTDARRRFE